MGEPRSRCSTSSSARRSSRKSRGRRAMTGPSVLLGAGLGLLHASDVDHVVIASQ
ncbi:Hypothetical protein A7982_01427 [Minicystis rosea]|nr:Hypothetical protein A7982_01427 [Minicystis rosea]